MFHSVKPIERLAEMNHLLEFQRKVLEFSIAVAQNHPKNKNTFKNLDQNNAKLNGMADWFMNVLDTNAETWNKYFDALIAELKINSQIYNEILIAFDNDIRFQDHLNDQDFRFLFPNLPEKIKSPIKDLFEYFYVYSRKTGYSEEIHNTSGFKLTRKDFIKSYVTTNGRLDVCPICDKEISDSDLDEDIAVCELDHFFPTSKYPFLSMHPYNLLPTCRECNSTYKFASDILWDSDSRRPTEHGFPKIYHPHMRRSISDLGQLIISGVGNEQEPYQFNIVDETLFSSSRIESARKAYKLLQRWTDRFVKQPNVRQRIVAQARTQVRERARIGINEYNILEMLDTLEYLTNQSKEGHYASVWTAYIDFIRNNSDEQALFYREYTGQPSPRSLE